MAQKVTEIRIIWDHDHGQQCEGWYVRRTFADGHEEDENLGGECDLPNDASDRDLVTDILPVDEWDFPVKIHR